MIRFTYFECDKDGIHYAEWTEDGEGKSGFAPPIPYGFDRIPDHVIDALITQISRAKEHQHAGSPDCGPDAMRRATGG